MSWVYKCFTDRVGKYNFSVPSAQHHALLPFNSDQVRWDFL